MSGCLPLIMTYLFRLLLNFMDDRAYIQCAGWHLISSPLFEKQASFRVKGQLIVRTISGIIKGTLLFIGQLKIISYAKGVTFPFKQQFIFIYVQDVYFPYKEQLTIIYVQEVNFSFKGQLTISFYAQEISCPFKRAINPHLVFVLVSEHVNTIALMISCSYKMIYTAI